MTGYKHNKTILFSTSPPENRRFTEKPTGSAATATSTYPGAFIPASLGSPATFFKQSMPGTKATGVPINTRLKRFVVEHDWQGINSPTTPGDIARAYHAKPGDVIFGLVATGNTYSPGDLLRDGAVNGSTYGALAPRAATGATANAIAMVVGTLATASSKVTASRVALEVL